MAVENVSVNSAVDASGNSYTTAISNDKLTNDDFLKLLLEEMKLQDPTKPMDSQRMLDSQLQMSSIETNLTTVEAMKSLQSSFSQMAVANASSLVNRIIENGEMSDEGIPKQFKISSVELNDGETNLIGYAIEGYDPETGEFTLAQDKSIINFNDIEKIF
jgi:flagellar basal-body rod modification protein FlgD